MHRIFQPMLFQGVRKKKNYFEGWYYKLISEDRKSVIALIIGISLGKDGENHAFIQFFDALSGRTEYLRYPLSDFRFENNRFCIKIGKNLFTRDGIRLNIQSKEISIRGELRFSDIISYPWRLTEPGIMGPFSFIPFMECYHGIVNIHHKISGSLIIDGKRYEMNGGYGYIEKDWGRSFPESWIWTQSNHFANHDASFMFSVAKIPFFITNFTGFLCFLRIGKNFYRFATYSNAKIVYMRKKAETLEVLIKDGKYFLKFRAVNHRTGTLLAPLNGNMHREIEESISATVHVSLWDKKGNILFRGIGKQAGLEIVGYDFNL